MKVFYSWQSDTPREVGKDLVREALDRAVAGLDIEEAERPVVDQDTAGVLGSPVIAETIFGKIRGANVVVVDVTLTGKTMREKRLINSNVAIEMGYSLAVHGDEVLVKVMNTHYGSPEDLPFDLRHRRWPLRFSLSPDANQAQRERVLSDLASDLRSIIGQYIEASRPPPEVFSPTQSTYNRAIYWQPPEALVEIGDPTSRNAQRYTYDPDKPLIYLHIWPHEKIEPLSASLLTEYDKVSIEPLCGTPSGWSNHRNRFGHIAYAWQADTNQLLATTQVLKTGEIWGLNQYMLRERPPQRSFVPIPAFETRLRKSMTQYLTSACTHFRYSRTIHADFGMVNVNGFVLLLPNDVGSDRIFEDIAVSATLRADDAASVEAALVEIFDAVYEAAGEIRR
jgi:hypothetical protein